MKLKRCPFCGEKQINLVCRKRFFVPEQREAGGYNLEVWCITCGANGPQAKSYSKARKAWNKRRKSQ